MADAGRSGQRLELLAVVPAGLEGGGRRQERRRGGCFELLKKRMEVSRRIMPQYFLSAFGHAS